jgi:hypothetical protein
VNAQPAPEPGEEPTNRKEEEPTDRKENTSPPSENVSDAGADAKPAQPSGPAAGEEPDAAPQAEEPADEAAPRFEPDPVDPALTDEEQAYQEERQRLRRQWGLDRLFRPGAGSTFAGGSHSTAVGRDYIHYEYHGPGTEAPQLRPGPLLPQQLERLRGTYVPTNSHAEVISLLNGRHLILLNGRQGTGRRATALIALDDFIRSAREADEATVCVELMDELPSLSSALDISKMRKGHGYVCAVLDGKIPASGLLSSLQSRLRDEAGAYLLVTGDWAARPRDDLARDYLVDHDPPPASAILRKYLHRELGQERVTAVLNDLALDEELARLTRPADAAEFAAYVIAGLRLRLPVGTILAGWRPANKITEAEGEFKDGDRWKRSFLLACAVLDGQPAGTVSRATQFLMRLQSENGEPNAAEAPATPIEDWAACVRTSDAAQGAPAGSGRIVQLEHPTLGPAILRTAWQSHVGMREAILPWLRHLADHDEIDVRMAAAQIVGKLATYDFDVIRFEILAEWAGSGRFNDRQATAWAVEALAQQDRFAGRVRKLVRGWARSGDTARCATAIAVYGTSYGAYHPHEAIDAMRRIAGSRVLAAKALEQALARTISQSMTEMSAAGANTEVLSALGQWAHSDAWLIRWAAARCLTRLARQTEDRNGDRAGWPALLSLIDKKPALQQAVTALWQNALTEGPITESSWEALRYWLESDKRVRAEDSEYVRKLLREFLFTLAENARVRDRLRFHVDLWEFRRRRRITSMPDELRKKRSK